MTPATMDPLPGTERALTKAEIGLGALTVPRASFYLPTEPVSKQSDLTLLATVRQLFQFNNRFAIGAGVEYGLRPSTDTSVTASPDGPIRRVHARNYFLVEALARLYPIATDRYEVWAGVSGGVIIVSDRYALDATSVSIVGPTSTTVGSEGGHVDVGVGVDWRLGPRWSVGAWTNEMLWFLPVRHCAQTLECATLGGKVFSLELGLTVGYRLGL